MAQKQNSKPEQDDFKNLDVIFGKNKAKADFTAVVNTTAEENAVPPVEMKKVVPLEEGNDLRRRASRPTNKKADKTYLRLFVEVEENLLREIDILYVTQGKPSGFLSRSEFISELLRKQVEIQK